MRNAVLVGLVILFAVGIAFLATRLNHRSLHKVTGDALAWSATQAVPDGQVRTLNLPAFLAHASIDGRVTVAHTAGGRYCVLLKRSVSGFDGRLACSAPLAPSEIVTPTGGGKPYVSLPGYAGFEQLTIREQLDDCNVDVSH